MSVEAGPYAIVSLIVAPAVLTNACSMLAMSTSNRLARAVDRAQELSRHLEPADDFASAQATRRLAELVATEQRALLLVRSLRSFYVALGGFAIAALLALGGALLTPVEAGVVSRAVIAGAGTASVLAVTALVSGSWLLLRETRIAVKVLSERAAGLRERAGGQG